MSKEKGGETCSLNNTATSSKFGSRFSIYEICVIGHRDENMNPFSGESQNTLASFKISIMEAKGFFQAKINRNTLYFASSTHYSDFIAYKARIYDFPSTNKS